MTAVKANKVKRQFEDCTAASLQIHSSWEAARSSRASRSVQCQTSEDIFVLREMEVQTGISTAIIQDQVSEKHRQMSLIDYYTSRYPKRSEESWTSKIADGFITVDCEVVTDPAVRVDAEYFLEFVDSKAHVGIQTVPLQEVAEQLSGRALLEGSRFSRFLSSVAPMIFQTLDANLSQDALFAANAPSSSAGAEGSELLTAAYIRQLAVDLEKKKILYPDWSKAQRYPGVILKCTLTRNKDRVYDIEYDDGARLTAVKEEYIRLIGLVDSKKSATNRLREGVRVHCKRATGKVAKYLPGRVVKCLRSAANASTSYEVDVEGTGQIETFVEADLVVGLTEGQRVEAKRPTVAALQCTSLSFNSTGNMLAVAYGRHDLSGWCSLPGAVCCWNLSQEASAPEVVLDHNVCLLSVSCHPVVPSFIAAGSYNGELLVWDMSSPDQLAIASPISDYAHQQPLTALQWVANGNSASSSTSSGVQDSHFIVTGAGDGRLLFWSLRNRLLHPVRGHTLSSASSGVRRQFGWSAVAVLCISPQWLVLGLGDGRVLRGQAQRLFTSSEVLTAETLRSLPNPEDVFAPLSKKCSLLSIGTHIGPVTCAEPSPWHRHLLLSAGCDGRLHLCHLLCRTPVATYEPGGSISSVRFSPVRPAVFAVATSEGAVHLYDLMRDPSRPVLVLEVTTSMGSAAESSGKASKVAVTGLAFNGRRRDLLTACDWTGKIHLWRLPSALCAPLPKEQAFWDRMGRVAGGDADGEEAAL